MTDREEALKELEEVGLSKKTINTIRKALEAKEPEELRQEVERLRACLKFAKHALEPYDDVKPRNWLTDKDNLREAHQSILKILAPQIEGK
jgi:predicted metal-dependent hydrolase